MKIKSFLAISQVKLVVATTLFIFGVFTMPIVISRVCLAAGGECRFEFMSLYEAARMFGYSFLMQFLFLLLFGVVEFIFMYFLASVLVWAFGKQRKSS